MIAPEVRARIQQELDRIEVENGVRILHAIESGSRAWGFPSADSDYDVRIIYAHPRDWYLSVREGRDVIERPLSDVLDIGGWDLRKTLRLLGGGNAVVHEWLGSPEIYRRDENASTALKALAARAFDPRAAFHHYLAMAGNKLAVPAGEAPTAKRFLYGMRTLLCARWAAELGTPPPMRFSVLLDRYVPPGQPLRARIDALVAAKAHGFEKDVDAGVADLFAAGEAMLAEDRARPPPEARRIDEVQLDEVLRQLLVAR